MFLATIRITVRIAVGFRSKRRTVRAIVAKIHHHFNVSVAEIGRPEHPSETVIGVAALGTSRREVLEVLDRVADAVASHPRSEITAIDRIDY